MNLSFGSISIQFERPFYSSGDQVNAIINLHLTQDFPGNTIFMYILGVEEVKLVESKEVSRREYNTRYRTRQTYFQFYEYSKYNGTFGMVPNTSTWDDELFYDDDRNSRVKVTFDHYQFKNIVNKRFQVYQGPSQETLKGQYSFPVSFPLPTGLPASFDMNWTEEGRLCFGNISYKIQVSLESSNPNVVPIQAQQEFAVNQIVQGLNKNFRIRENKNVKSCCCMNKGFVQITSYFERGEYRGGDTAYIVTEVDNGLGKARIRDLRGEFVQEVELRTESYNKIIKNVLNSHSIAGMLAGERRVGDNAQRIQVELIDKDGPIQPTSKGQLITNKYSLVARAEVDACVCCDEHPNAKAEVNILSRGTEVAQDDSVPGAGTSWKPTIMAHFNASLGGGEGVGNKGDHAVTRFGGYEEPPEAVKLNSNMAKTDYPEM